MSQEVISGSNSTKEIKKLLLKRGYSMPFIIMGEHLRKIQSSLFDFDYIPYYKNGPNVLQGEMERCCNIFATAGASAIIAIGGGSVIDLAKAVICNMVNKQLPAPFFICVPTTAGSGSEATRFAVIYKNNIKTSLDDAALLPRTVVLDPQLTHSLAPLQTAIPGMDAMCQAIESYWNIYADGPSKSFSAEAIGLLKEHLPVAVSAPTAIAREKVLWASHLAGKAINITRTTGPHALSYYLTANHNVPHGQAVAFFLPVFFLYNGLVDAANCNDTDGPKKVLTTLRELYILLNVTDAAEAAQYLQQLMKKMGMAVRLQELGIDKHDILDPLINSINEQRFGNNPVALNKDVLKELCLKYL